MIPIITQTSINNAILLESNADSITLGDLFIILLLLLPIIGLILLFIRWTRKI